jgi:DNA-binding NarL/FixJ family response regulator
VRGRRVIQQLLLDRVSVEASNREVLALMAEGRSNQGIGDHLYLSPKTVEGHIGSIMTKLRSSSGAARPAWR